MRKRVILALLLIISLAVTSGCGLIVKDAEVDRQTVIIDVQGKTFNKGEVLAAAENVLAQQEYLYSMYGLPFDRTSAASIESARQEAASLMIEQEVLANKQAEFGVNVLTDEEKAAVQSQAESTYQIYFDSVQSSFFADTELVGDDLKDAIEEKMLESGYPTLEYLLEGETETKISEKLKAEVVKDVVVSDEEIQADYDQKMQSDKDNYMNDITAYGAAVQSGTTVYYHPAGYRYVKNILIKIGQEDADSIAEMESQLSEKQQQIEALTPTSGVTEGEEAAEEDVANEETKMTIDTLQKEVIELEKKLEQKREDAYAAIQPTIDEILQKLADGGVFDALMEEYGQDDGMKASPAKEQGYLVCEGDAVWVPEFTEAAMELGAVGDISPAVKTSYGIHLLQYVGDLVEGAVPLEDVREVISAELLTAKQDEAYNDKILQWVSEADAKTFLDRLN